MLPLFDVNEVFVREVSAHEAQQLLEAGEAEPMSEIGIKLAFSRDYCGSASCLTARDAQLIAGEFGDSDEARASREKFTNWRASE